MPAAFVKATNFGSDAVSSSVISSAFSTATATGNAIIAVVFGDDAGATRNITSITDSNSNAYTLVGTEFHDSNGNMVRIGYSLNITGDSSHTVQGNYVGGTVSFRRIVAFEVSGLLTSSAFDQVAYNQVTSSAPATTAVVTTADGEFIFAVAYATTGGSDAFSPGTDFIEPSNSTALAGSGEAMVEYQIQSSAGSISAPFLRSFSNPTELGIATFKAGGAPASTPPTFNIGFAHIGQKVRMVGY